MQDNPHRLWIPAYLIAGVLLFFPTLDFGMQLWPFQPFDGTWRYGAVGLGSRMLLTPLLALFLAFAVALMLSHGRSLRLFALVCGLGSLLVVIAAGMFVFDQALVRSVVTEETLPGFDRNSRVVLLKLALALLPLIAITVFGWKAGTWASSKKEAPKPGIVTARGHGARQERGQPMENPSATAKSSEAG